MSIRTKTKKSYITEMSHPVVVFDVFMSISQEDLIKHKITGDLAVKIKDKVLSIARRMYKRNPHRIQYEYYIKINELPGSYYMKIGFYDSSGFNKMGKRVAYVENGPNFLRGYGGA